MPYILFHKCLSTLLYDVCIAKKRRQAFRDTARLEYLEARTLMSISPITESSSMTAQSWGYLNSGLTPEFDHFSPTNQTAITPDPVSDVGSYSQSNPTTGAASSYSVSLTSTVTSPSDGTQGGEATVTCTTSSQASTDQDSAGWTTINATLNLFFMAPHLRVAYTYSDTQPFDPLAYVFTINSYSDLAHFNVDVPSTVTDVSGDGLFDSNALPKSADLFSIKINLNAGAGGDYPQGFHGGGRTFSLSFTWETDYGTVAQPDLALQKVLQPVTQGVPDTHNVSVTYMITQADVTSPLGFSVYQSDQPLVDGKSALIGTQTLPTSDTNDLRQGNHTINLGLSTSIADDPTRPYIVVVANPDGSINEAPDSVNVVSTKLSTDLTATIDNTLNGIHRLLYQSQALTVPLILSNTGEVDVTGNANIAIYLSTDQTAALTEGDDPLGSATDQTLDVVAGKNQTLTPPLTATIPTTTKVGTYYIKVVISPGSQNPISLSDGNVVAVSPALNEYAATPMVTGTPLIYEHAVSVVKANPSVLPAEFKAGMGDQQIETYIKNNEGFSDTPYMDSQGIPTIGYGFNLQNSNAPSRMAALGLDYATVIKYARLNGQRTNVSGGYNNTIKAKVSKAVAQGWFNQDYPAAKKGLLPALNSVHITPADYANLSSETKIVLIDMYYNMGSKYINGPTGKAFPAMLEFIKGGNLAAAAFELMDSQYATQVGRLNSVRNRALYNFELLAYGQAKNL